MSFAQGLLAGTQAARNVMDSYKEARDARVQREFAQGLAALDEQGAGPNQFTPDMMPEAAPDPNAPINMAGLANTPQMTAPTMPLSPQQRLQQQIALANRLGLRQEAANFTNQLGQLTQREEDMQYRAQRDTMSDIDRERERQDRLNQTSIDRNQRAAFDALNYKLAEQRQGIAQSAENREADAAAAQQAVRAAQDAYANSYNEAVSSGNYAGIMNVPEGVDPGAWQRVVYENLERDLGVSRQQLTSTSSRLSESVNSLVGREFENPQEQFQAWQGLVNELYDSDYSDGVPVEIVDIPRENGGGFLIREGNREVARVASLDELGAMAQGVLEKDPLGAALGVELNARSADARAQARFERDLEVLKLQAPDKRAALKALSDLKSALTWGSIPAADKIIRENEIRELWGLPLLKGAQGLTQQQNDPLSSLMGSFD
jgi:hypothetical protein